MAMVDLRLALKGQGESLEGVKKQGRVSLKLYEDNKDALHDNGFSPEDGARLKKLVEYVESAEATRDEARAGSLGNTRAEHAAVAEAKALIRKIRTIWRTALRRKPVEGLTVGSVNSGGPLARETSKIVKYLGDLHPVVKQADASLAPFFKAAVVSELVAQAKKSLEESDATQTAGIAQLPEGTQKVYEAKGMTVELVEELNAVAKLAFDGDAVKIGQFNKDVLLAERKKKPEKVAEPVPG